MNNTLLKNKQDKIEKFNEWMIKIKNIHYADHKRMLLAYENL